MKKSPPKHLSAEARVWYSQIRKEYGIEDSAGLALLAAAAGAFDRAESARREIAKDGGCVIRDRFGQPKQHPAAAVERDARSQVIQALKALNLDFEPTRAAPGRPPGR